MRTITNCTIVVSAFFGQYAHFIQYRDDEPCKPDTFPGTICSDAAHSVVPVSCSYQRQIMDSGSQRVFDGANEVLVERAFFFALLEYSRYAPSVRPVGNVS